MTGIALIFIGYSLLAALSIALLQLRPSQYPDAAVARWLGLVVLGALMVLQAAHFVWLLYDLPWVSGFAYQAALFAVAPAFYLYCRWLLYPSATLLHLHNLWHGLPVLAAWALPPGLSMPAAFWLGALYLLALGRRLFSLRRERVNFRAEILLLGFVFVVAIGVSLLGALQGLLPDKLFFCLYACAIGVALFFVQLALGLRPSLAVEVSETVRASYQSSSLNQVDCEAALARLAALMEQEQLYTHNDLSLAKLAQRLSLSTHQVSELLNSRLGKSFSRYLREARVQAAKQMLIKEPAASVLSVGLSVGFTSQSTFYEAFREIDGMTPGQYRKLQSATSSSNLNPPKAPTA